ncbi:uncharacterized protein LACBIDRAFT_330853 [Laccaria bicolor S238N-H82]|uniref:Predicted protein n=1 Tax=Laccaria bicolor (strain S238N-H82 / ATCC MYA-4686) TaxID=486041 RepID=B0DMP7_LACBS|nr:uncharacterized protein LACBIDRAFT_330853 [Laccaria bicolor S238N-H82]EDR04324.1 predicted protein [Laccaria bicolor S238N-H82]|eukprot:XP_001885215.1 predicted protein [Laccaria bicolor S238N-H82]
MPSSTTADVSHASIVSSFAPTYSAIRSPKLDQRLEPLGYPNPDALFVVTYMVYVPPSGPNLCPYHKNSLSPDSALTQRRSSVYSQQEYFGLFGVAYTPFLLQGKEGLEAVAQHVGYSPKAKCRVLGDSAHRPQ